MRDTAGDIVPPSPPEPSPVQNWMQFAANDKKLAEMLTYAGSPVEWSDIYKAYELAQRIVGGANRLKRLLGRSAPACENMRQTANYHRHANGETHKPRMLTVLSEAGPLLALVLRVVFEVLGQRSRAAAEVARPDGKPGG